MLDERQNCLPENESAEKKEKRLAEQYIRGLIITREAAKPLPNGKLPPGATHEIIETEEGELPKVRRRRFSLI